jgi:hydroxymethylpyrimidine pyrophosphatase-like HAD family hydrolase
MIFNYKQDQEDNDWGFYVDIEIYPNTYEQNKQNKQNKQKNIPKKKINIYKKEEEKEDLEEELVEELKEEINNLFHSLITYISSWRIIL